MAITFTKARSITEYLNGFNNNIVQFSSDDVLDSTQCNINIGGKDFVITPNTSNVFRFNFLEVVEALISGRFVDGLTYGLPNEYEDTDLYWSYLVTYTITFTDDSTEQTSETFRFLRSVAQIGDTQTAFADGLLLHQSEITVFNGYPFDLSYLNDAGSFDLVNKTNGKVINFTSGGDATRVIFGSGLIGLSEFAQRVDDDSGTIEVGGCHDIAIVDFLNIGFNDVCFVQTGFADNEITIELKDICEGVYLKWFNREGSWSYWLFEKIYKQRIKTKIIDRYTVDFENLEDTTQTKLITGKTSEKTRFLKQTSITQPQRLQIKDVLTAPRVELYTGTQNGGLGTWQTVVVKQGGFNYLNTKNQLSIIKFEIEINDYNN